MPQRSKSIVAHPSERSLEARLRHRQPRNVTARAEHRTFQGTIVSVVGRNRVKIAHIGAAEGDTGHRLGRYLDSPIDSAVGLEAHDLAWTHYDRCPHAALCVYRHAVGSSIRNLRE